METLLQIFSSMIVFFYHCFDRIVINGYLSMLSRPENVVYFFRDVVGVPCITKEVLSSRTNQYNRMIESYARKHKVPIQWAEKKVRKEEFVRPYLKAMEQQNLFGVYFIFKSMEQGPTFRSVTPQYPTNDPNYRIIKPTRSRFTHYYFYIRDEKLGAISIRVASYFPFQTTCWLNGHNYIERQLLDAGISFSKKDNAFTATDNPNALQEAADRLSSDLIRQRLDYWTAIIGPQFSGKERKEMNLRRFYAISQIEYCHNFIFRRNFPIQKLFQRSCELGFFTLTAKKITNVFGWRINRRFKGKLQVVLERVDQSHHILRAYFKNSFVKQYEKLRTFLRLEICSNNVYDLRIKKSLDNFHLVRETSKQILGRFANIQANALNAHFDFPLLQRLALPITQVNTKIPGIKIHDRRMIRLMETIMHYGISIDGWSSAMIHETIIKKYALSNYSINQLRYDLRKMKAHGLIERNGSHYSYWITDKGAKVATMFILFHKRLCGPLANSLFHHKPDKRFVAESKLEKAYCKADNSIEQLIDLLAA